MLFCCLEKTESSVLKVFCKHHALRLQVDECNGDSVVCHLVLLKTDGVCVASRAEARDLMTEQASDSSNNYSIIILEILNHGETY